MMMGACVLCSYIQPEFRTEKITCSSLELHYHSRLTGLGPWVEGILEAVATDIHKSSVKLTLLRGREDGSCDHEVGATDTHSL